MILKLITCTPKPELEKLYLSRQRIWNQETFRREHVKAHIMAETGDRVYIKALWSEQSALDRFMNGTHEWLMREHPLSDLLQGYTVAYFDFVEPIVMPCDFERIHAGEAVMRMTANRVPEHAFAEFMKVLREIWNPRIAQAVGFMGGRVWRRRDDPTEVHMTTYFRNEATNENYERTVRPVLTVEGRRVFELGTGIGTVVAKVTDMYSR